MGKLDEAKILLIQLGFPVRQQNDRSAYTLLALLNLKEYDSWNDATNQLIGIHAIINFISANYGLQYAENSRESIRRQTIHQFEQASIIERNADDKTRATNSGKTVYSITKEALNLIKVYGTEQWDEEVGKFVLKEKTLAEKYAKKRDVHKVPIEIEGKVFNLSSGEHNVLQKEIIEDFGAIFAKGSKLLYLGDTANKDLYKLDYELENIGIPITQHDKLPDVVLYDSSKNWLYLCEAVTSHGPVSPKRYIELEAMLKNCSCGKIYVSCFLDKQTYKTFMDDIAWETEVWIANEPTHMIHLNGDRFMGPR